MKLIFSEVMPDYTNYQFPYVVWAAPEQDEPISELYSHGFMPSKSNPPIYYLSRSVRVNLANFSPSSENRRILRKHPELQMKIIPRTEMVITEEIIDLCLNCAAERFGKDVMPRSRLNGILSSPYTSHFLCFFYKEKLTGLVTVFMNAPHFAHYSFAFYNVNEKLYSMGAFMMTSAVLAFSLENIQYVYLGSCYSQRALYKTQFKGCEFFNGFRWSDNIKELKYIIHNDEQKTHIGKHLLEFDEYLENFCGDFQQLIYSSKISVTLE